MDTAIKSHELLTIRGKEVRIGRLGSSAETAVFFEHLAPAVGPLLGEVLEKLSPFIEAGINGKQVPEQAWEKSMGISASIEKLVATLNWKEVRTIAEKVLSCTTYQGRLIWEQIDAVCVTALDWIKLVVAALQFLYSDFSEVLGLLRSRKRRQEVASASEGSTASAGPSGG